MGGKQTSALQAVRREKSEQALAYLDEGVAKLKTECWAESDQLQRHMQHVERLNRD